MREADVDHESMIGNARDNTRKNLNRSREHRQKRNSAALTIPLTRLSGAI